MLTCIISSYTLLVVGKSPDGLEVKGEGQVEGGGHPKDVFVLCLRSYNNRLWGTYEKANQLLPAIVWPGSYVGWLFHYKSLIFHSFEGDREKILHIYMFLEINNLKAQRKVAQKD